MKKVTAQELLDFGLEPAVLWNTDRQKEIDADIFIVSILKKGYAEHVIVKLCDFFGKDRVLSALKKHSDEVSRGLFEAVSSKCMI